MFTQAAAGRLVRLTAHLQIDAQSSSSSAGGLHSRPTAAAAAATAPLPPQSPLQATPAPSTAARTMSRLQRDQLTIKMAWVQALTRQ